MDRICESVFQKICSLAPLGRYVIISEDEFWEVFPEESERNETELDKALKKLISDRFIDVKYSGGDMFCVAPLKNYENAQPISVEPQTAQQDEKPLKRQSALTVFFAALIGGALGSFIISLVFALI